MPRGIVVDHKETGVRYAVSPHNYQPAIHTKVRDLLPGETVLGFKPKPRRPLREVPSEVTDIRTKQPRRESNRHSLKSK